MVFTVENICGFLIRSKLLTPEEVRALQQRWQAEAKDQAGSISQFSKWLVANRYVTEYQAVLLAKGHADSFFLNQYKILDRLGQGRMAGVYKAEHTLGQVVAIKVLPPSKAKNPQLLGRFQREARMALRLKHPNVVRTYQLGEANDVQYLVMEYLEGETLDEVLQRRRKLPPTEAVRLIHQALMGLQHIHEQGMVHRDLKPANLMLAPASGRGDADTTLKSTVKILDIGLGRFFEDSPQSEKMELTGEGVLLGTPDYLAPEQARDARAIDIRADIYSLGCVLYHALTGQPPFPDKNLLSQMVRHATETAKPLKEFNPAIPDGLQQIINWMLAKKPEERYPTPERAAQALQVFLVADSEPVRAAGEEPHMRKYLTWLETADNGQGAPVPAAPVPVSAPLAIPAGGAPQAKPVAPFVPPSEPRRSKLTPTPPTRPAHHKKKHRHRKPISAEPPVAQPALSSEIDVELVSWPAAQLPTEGPVRRSSLTRREWTLLGIGAGAVIFAGIVGMVLALIFKG
ncbi:MAG TPA: serine/threonine-protein kinase [Gemmataceae bacterium]|nr:serine/threonine-protein kinase [Gemmataceae bacterium]